MNTPYKEIENNCSEHKLSDIINYKSLGNAKLPEVYYSYHENKYQISYFKLLNRFIRILHSYRSDNIEKMFYKTLFSLISKYKLGDLEKAMIEYNYLLSNYGTTEYFGLNLKLLDYIHSDLVKQRDILIIASVEYRKNNNFLYLRNYSDRIQIFMFNKYLSENKFDEWLGSYRHIYIIGHGIDNYIKVGNKTLSSEYILERIEKSNTKPIGMGFLSCGNLFKDTNICQYLQYLITDTFSSSSTMSEYFINGFISEFVKDSNVEKSYLSAQISMLLMNNLAPAILLYTRK